MGDDRRYALSLASKDENAATGGNSIPDKVVERAVVYLAFLKEPRIHDISGFSNPNLRGCLGASVRNDDRRMVGGDYVLSPGGTL